MIVEPCWNQPISSPFASGTFSCVVRGPPRTDIVRAEKVEADACHQYRRDGNQGDGMTGAGKPDLDRRSLILAEQALDAFERDRIDVPRIAGE